MIIFSLPLDSATVFKKAKDFCKFVDAYKTFDLNFPSAVRHELRKFGIKRKLFLCPLKRAAYGGSKLTPLGDISFQAHSLILALLDAFLRPFGV